MTDTTYEGEPLSSVVITLVIENSRPIEVRAFVHALTSLAAEYRESLERKGLDGEAELYIKEVRSGSIIVDLVPLVVTAFPTIVAHAAQADQAIDFAMKWGARLKGLAEGIVPEGASKADLRTFHNAVEHIARDPDASSTLEVATFEDGKRKVRVSMKFSSAEARAIEKTIEGEFRRIDAGASSVRTRVLMYFTRSDVGDAKLDKRSGERVVIPEVTDRDLPIMYASDLAEQRVKYEIREGSENIYKKGFSVDVDVQMRDGRPIVYRILSVHDVFNLPDAEPDS